MNKYLTSLVAVATVTSMGVVSIPAYADTQTAEQVKTLINSTINSLTVTNNTKESNIEASYSGGITNSKITANVSNFVMTPATKATTGSAVFNVDITDNTTTAAAVTTLSFDKEIDMLTATTTTQSAVQLSSKISNVIPGIRIYNDTTEQIILDQLVPYIYNADLAVTIENFVINPATYKTEGYATGNVVITDIANGNARTIVPINSLIYKLYTQADLDLINEVNSIIYGGLTITNDETDEKIQSAIKAGLSDQTISVKVHDSILEPATYANSGHYSSVATFTRLDGTTVDVYISRDIPIIPIEILVDCRPEFLQLADSMKLKLNTLAVDSNTTEKKVSDYINSLVTVDGMRADIQEFKIIPATETSNGFVTFYAKLTDTTNKDYRAMQITRVIAKTTAPTNEIANKLNTAKSIIASYLDSYSATNSTTESTIKSILDSKVGDLSVGVSINGYSLTDATYSSKGLCKFTVVLTASDGTTTSVNYSNDISQLTSSSSGGGSGSSSSSSVTEEATTETTTNGTDATITRPVSLANITKEVAKAIEQKVIINVSKTLGTGATVGQAKDVTTADGTKVSITTITKDGKSTVAVITAETSSAIATIPVSTDAGTVTAVYKYVPLLGKYIQLTDGITIGANAITLPTQANATYVAATTQLASTETVSAGWAKVDNNWYMVNAIGDPQIGWQKDSTGWTYLLPSNGVMQIGWTKTGNTWYYLKDNGYMATGWVNTNNNWYYLNTNGSMASNTTVDGYTLGSDGAWIK